MYILKILENSFNKVKEIVRQEGKDVNRIIEVLEYSLEDIKDGN